MSKVSKMTREDWLKIGAQSKLVLQILANYEQELYDKLGANHVTKKVQNAYKSVDTAKSTLDDMVFDHASKLFDNKEIADVIFGEPTEEQKPYIKELMDKAAERLHIEANTEADTN